MAVLVTGAFVEALLWIGIQLAGYKPEAPKKTLPLRQLVREAFDRHLLSQNLADLLGRFNDIRNDYAHDIDYKLDASAVDECEALLPRESRESLSAALENMPAYTVGTQARLVFSDMTKLTYESMRAALAV